MCEKYRNAHIQKDGWHGMPGKTTTLWMVYQTETQNVC
jgi:hypothetical protein